MMASKAITMIMQIRAARKRQRGHLLLLSLCSVFVVLCVALASRQAGVAKTSEVRVLECPVEGVAHAHNQDCYGQDGNLACTLPERPLHVHDDSCYVEYQQLICDTPESEGHLHDDACSGDDGALTCKLEESEGHVHADACYATTRVLACEKEELVEEHVHGPGCFQTVLVDDGEDENEATVVDAAYGADEADAPVGEQGVDVVDDGQPPVASTVHISNEAPSNDSLSVFDEHVEDADGNRWMRVRAEVPRAALPEGAVMSVSLVEESEAIACAESAVALGGAQTGEVARAEAVDIRFSDAQGNEVDVSEAFAMRITTHTVKDMELPQLAYASRWPRDGQSPFVLLDNVDLVHEDETDVSVGGEDTLRFWADGAGTYAVFEVVDQPDGALEQDAAKDASAQDAAVQDEASEQQSVAKEDDEPVAGLSPKKRGLSPTGILGVTPVNDDTVAMIGEVEYTSLADAIAAAQNDDTIMLVKAADTDDLEVRGKRITIDLNGQNGYQSGRYVQSGTLDIASDGELTLTNSVDQTIYFAKALNNYGSFTYSGRINFYRGITVKEGSTQTMLNGAPGTTLALVTETVTPLIELGPQFSPSDYGLSFSNAEVYLALDSDEPMEDIAIFSVSASNGEAIANRAVFASAAYNRKASFVYDAATGAIVVHKLTEEDAESFVVQNTNTGRFYKTLQAALTTAKGNSTSFAVLRDIETTGDIYAPNADSACGQVSIDLAGHTVKTNGALRIPSGKTLVLNNTATEAAAFQCDIDNKGALTLSGYRGHIDVDGSLYFTDNSGGGTPTNTLTLNAGNAISGWFMTDLTSVATLSSYYFRYLPENPSIHLWIIDNDELIGKLNGTQPTDDIVLFKVNPGTNATALQNVEKVRAAITIGGWGLDLADGVSLQVKYDVDNGTFVLHKKVPDEVVATIGEARYGTLPDAIYAAEDGDTISIVAPFHRVGCGYVYAPAGDEKTVTIDLNGHTVYAEADHRYLFYVTGSNALVLKNSSEDAATVSGHHIVQTGGQFTLENVIPDGNLSLYGSNKVTLRNTKDEPIVISAPLELKDGSELLVTGNFTFGGQVSLLSESTATLDGNVGTLRLVTDRASEHAVATLGENSAADSIEYTLTNATDIAMLNNSSWTGDYVIFKGGSSEIAGKIALSSGTFTNPLLSVVYDEAADQIVIRQMRGVFLNGQKGQDSWAGTVTRPVKTFSKALQLYLAHPDDYDGIYISGTVEVTGSETWDGGSDGVTLYRYPVAAAPRIENAATYPTASYFYTSDRRSNVPHLVAVAGTGASLTLKNVTIDGNKAVAVGQDSASMISVVQGATLTIAEGATLQNNNASSSSTSSVGGAVNANNATVNMTGGVIRSNEARSGGGLAVYGGAFNMSGGIICNNAATDGGSNGGAGGGGGGVDLEKGSAGATMNLTGGTISQNYSAYGGGGISVGRFNNAASSGSKLVMAGGTVADNTSRVVGGGICILSGHEAEITAGSITGNHAAADDSMYGRWGGGGIYVNGPKSNLGPGKLTLENVIIANNVAGFSGGGIAGCPTSDVSIYLAEGSAIYQNSAQSARDVFVDPNTTDLFYAQPSTLVSPLMLGGGTYLWKYESGEYVNHSTLNALATQLMLHNDHVDSDAEVQAAQALAQVFIEGNTSEKNGGGIGTNGIVIIGEPSQETVDIKGQKKWETGTLPSPYVRLVLERKIDEEAYEPVAYQEIHGDAPFGWSYTFEGLPIAEYRVSEDPSYVVDGKTIGELFEVISYEYNSQTGAWEITNQSTDYSVVLKLKKVNDAEQILGGSSFALETLDEDNRWMSVQGMDEIAPGNTDEQNPVSIGELHAGRYRLTEKVIPRGYISLTDAVYFEVLRRDGVPYVRLTDEDGVPLVGPGGEEATETEVVRLTNTTGTHDDAPSYVLTVINTPGVALPNTGGVGVVPYIAFGLAMLLLGSLLLVVRARSQLIARWLTD